MPECKKQTTAPTNKQTNIFNKTKQNKTKQNKTKQNKTKQNKTKQNKTKQNVLLLLVIWVRGDV